MPMQWPRALLRAALREVGYDAIGTRTLEGAVHHAAAHPSRGPVRLVLLDQDAMTDDEQPSLEKLRAQTPAASLVLLAPATRDRREGPWTRVITRPISIAVLVQEVEALVPLMPGLRKPID
jgi:DNA-binding response OmpR family regulator